MHPYEVVPTIAEIGEAAWNELVGDGGFYSSYRWIHAHESMPGLKSAYIVVRSGSRLQAAVQVSYAKHDISDAYAQGRFRETFDETARFALLGTRRGYRNSLLVADWTPPEERGPLIAELVRTAGEVAAGWNANALVAPYLPPDAVARLVAAHVVKRVEQAGSEGVLTLTGQAFDDYLAPFSSHRKVSIRHERAHPRQMGLRFRVEEVGPGCAEQLAGLVAQVEAKYGRPATANGLRRYLTDTFEGDPAHARLFTCRDGDGRLVSAMLGYVWGSELYARATATDYTALPSGSFAYFNVVYYEPIEYCLSHGLSTLYFGVGTMGAKTARGSRELPLHHVLLSG
ncbi:GNAT family N-acetyltransferase [Streptomyces sp. NPDC058459]|uniref:GNAT family N-acetyltransferase n=1 Tax=Streptomyces sp. NPDC058459 TaxID=3346508 RepID=UPI00364D0FAF